MGLGDTVSDAVNIYTRLNPLFEDLIIAILIFVLGLVAGKLLGKFVKKILHEVELDNALKSATGWNLKIEKSLSTFVMYFTYFIALTMALDSLGVTSSMLNMIAGLVILVLLISVLLAIKDVAPNLISGLLLKNNKDYKIGRSIMIKGIEGKIKEIGIIETKIITKKKDTVLIPNSLFSKNETIFKK